MTPHAVPAPRPADRAAPGLQDASAPTPEGIAPPAQDLLLWASLCDAAPGDGNATAAHAAPPPNRQPTSVQALEQLTAELRELAEAAATGAMDDCSFDLDLPGLGRLQGRLRAQHGHFDLELRALAPSAAAALRARRQALQQGLNRDMALDVRLCIA